MNILHSLASLIAKLPKDHPVVKGIEHLRDNHATAGDMMGYAESYFLRATVSPEKITPSASQFAPVSEWRLALMSSENPLTPPSEANPNESEISNMISRIRTLLDGNDVVENLSVLCAYLNRLTLPSEIAALREAIVAPSERQLLLEIALQGSLTVKDQSLDSRVCACPSRELQKSLIESPPYFMNAPDLLEQAYKSEGDPECRKMIQNGLLTLKEDGKLSPTRYARIIEESPLLIAPTERKIPEITGSRTINSPEMLLEEIVRLSDRLQTSDDLREIAIKLKRFLNREGSLEAHHVHQILQKAVSIETPESPWISPLRRFLYTLNPSATRNTWEKLTGTPWVDI